MLNGQVIIQGTPTATEVGRPELAAVMVVHFWSSANGWCYDCGNPAAYFLPRAYINKTETPDAPDEEPNEHNKRCCVCAAEAAAYGETIRRIVEDEVEEEE